MAELEKQKQFAYLNADNVERYRRIMHFFYQQNQRMNNLLYKEQVLDGLLEDDYGDYDSDNLDGDLEQLTLWGNLTARQEMSQPKTIAEFKNKFYRYQITAVGIAIEELVNRLPKEDESNSDLDSHMFERLLDTLNVMNNLDEQALADNWDDLLDRFDKIRKNATGYVNYLTSKKVEDLMQTTAFLAYKGPFIHYLNDFVRKMQQTSISIQTALQNVRPEQINQIVELEIAHEKNKPSLEPRIPKDIDNQIRGTWQIINNWFIDQMDRESEYSNLIDQTTQALSRVTGIIQTLTESNQQHQSRSKDYIQIANWFQQLIDKSTDHQEMLNQANQLSSIVFGFDNTRHIQATSMEVTNQLDELWDMEVPQSELTSKSRKNRARMNNKPFKLEPEKQAQVLKEYQEQNKRTKEMWESYLQDDRLLLSEHKQLPDEMRHDLIRYFSRAMADSMHRVSTDMNWDFEISIDLNTLVTIQFTDGYLTMPNAEFKIRRR
jgi:uncharacterized protein (TIGR02677 family)